VVGGLGQAAEVGEGVEDFLDLGFAGAFERFSDGCQIEGDTCGLDVGGEGAHLLGEGGGPEGGGRGKHTGCRAPGRWLAGSDIELGLYGLGGDGVLVVGAQIPDLTLGLLGGTLLVQRDKALEDGLVVKLRGPAVGGGDGAIEVVVQLLEDGDEPLFALDVATPVG